MTATHKVVTASEMMTIENRWFDSGAITLEELMDRVGRAIADWVLNDLGDRAENATVFALAGKGNNGGDGNRCRPILGRGWRGHNRRSCPAAP